jgi:hypothetical protein
VRVASMLSSEAVSRVLRSSALMGDIGVDPVA